MNYKERSVFLVFMVSLLFFLVMTIFLGAFIITEGVVTDLVIMFVASLLLLLLNVYLMYRFVKKSNYKGYVYLCFKTLIIMVVMILVVGVVAFIIGNIMLAAVIVIIMSFLMALYLLKDVREKGIYKESSKVCCSYKYVKVFGDKNQTENVKVGDVLNGPFLRNKKVWELKNKNRKIVGCVYRPDIMKDLKKRKIQGLNSFCVSKIDSKGNVYVDIDVYISKYNALNGWVSYDNTLEKTDFIIDTNKRPAKSLTINIPIFESINSKFTLQSREVFLDNVFGNVKVVDYNNYNANIFDNEKLEVCYDKNDSILLLSNFGSVPVGHIRDEKIKGLINSYNDSDGIVLVSVQKIENNDKKGKKDVYVKIFLYDDMYSTIWSMPVG